MPEPKRNYVDGEWIVSETGETVDVENPADTNDVVNTYQSSSTVDAEEAITAADAAFDEWAATPAPDRGAILRETGAIIEERKDELAKLLSREEGKPLSSATGEVQRASNIFYYYAEKAMDFGGTIKGASGGRTSVSTRKEPLGVAGLITPWNYPVAIPAWKIAPALATGNTVVIKPATLAPGPAHEIARALDDAGLPDGVLNLVVGAGSEVGSTITEHDAVETVSFTGSSKVGHLVYDQATDETKRAQAEMGGKNPAIVTQNADVDEAVDIVGAGAFGVTGQACTATSRAIVHEDVYDEFVEGIVEYAEAMGHGPGVDDPAMGPHVSEDELEGTLEYVDVARTEGATHETGGERLEDGDLANGYFVSPAVFSDVTPDMRIFREEVFGPLLGVIEVANFDEAVAVANDSDYGLSASIITDDLAETNEFVERSESGIVKVNETTTGAELHVPFGGVKRSSTNTFREQGDAAIDFFTQLKTVYMNH